MEHASGRYGGGVHCAAGFFDRKYNTSFLYINFSCGHIIGAVDPHCVSAGYLLPHFDVRPAWGHDRAQGDIPDRGRGLCRDLSFLRPLSEHMDVNNIQGLSGSGRGHADVCRPRDRDVGLSIS